MNDDADKTTAASQISTRSAVPSNEGSAAGLFKSDASLLGKVQGVLPYLCAGETSRKMVGCGHNSGASPSTRNMEPTLKTIVVKQPWAWLLFNGKDIENRRWYSTYRGPLIIQSSKRAPTRAYYDVAWRFAADRGIAVPPLNSLVLGALLGVVEQIDCVASHRSPWFEGPYGHVYENPHMLSPIPASGGLGMRVPDDALLAQIRSRNDWAAVLDSLNR